MRLLVRGKEQIFAHGSDPSRQLYGYLAINVNQFGSYCFAISMKMFRVAN